MEEATNENATRGAGPKLRATLASLHTMPVTVANAIGYVVSELPELGDPHAGVSGSDAISVLAAVYPLFKDALNAYPPNERTGQLSAPWAPPELLDLLERMTQEAPSHELATEARAMVARYRPEATDQEPVTLPAERVASALAAAGIAEEDARQALLGADSPVVAVLLRGGHIQESVSNVLGIDVLVVDADPAVGNPRDLLRFPEWSDDQGVLPYWVLPSHDPDYARRLAQEVEAWLSAREQARDDLASKSAPTL